MLQEDDELIQKNKEKFISKASTLVSEWEKGEAVKMKQEDQ